MSRDELPKIPQQPVYQHSLAAVPQLTHAKRLGRYWLLRLMARGGMGEVYLAATTGIEGAERPCVIKVIRREHAKDASFQARFLDEARVQAQLQHGGVVQVIEAATDEDGDPFVAVEYVEGRSLSEVRSRAMQANYSFGWAEAVALGTSIAEALVHIHERVDACGVPLCIVHRDMSPQNIMVGYGGEVKLIDFGTARGENRRCHTVAGVVFAKPGYVAPEVANGNVGDQRVDLYALGVMMWELAAGRRFLQDDPPDHLAKVASNACNPSPIASLIGAPPEFDAIIAKLTAFDVNERYASARHALRDIARLLSSAPSLTNGERGVRARIAHIMGTLYPSEPTQSRRLFAKLVARAREQQAASQHRECAQTVAHSYPSTSDAVDSASGHHAACTANFDAVTPSDAVAGAGDGDGRNYDNLLPGTRYRVMDKIGEGAMGSVFEAEHVELGRRVAIKVLNAQVTSPDQAVRFRREARSLSRMSHPNLVTIHDFGQATDGRVYCAMELLQGVSLDHYMRQRGCIPWREVLRLSAQAASALVEAHNANVIHRDIKPSNLFVCSDGSLKVLDFGLARRRSETHERDSLAFTLFGTPEYMAPEQVQSGDVDGRADVYALGCVMFEMLTGSRPIEASSTVALLDAKTKKDAVFPEEFRQDHRIPAQVERLVLKALERDPEQRTPSAAQLLRDIHAAIDAPFRQRRQRRTKTRVAVALSLGAIVMTLSVVAARRNPDQVRAAVDSILDTPTAAAVVDDVSPSVPPASQETQNR